MPDVTPIADGRPGPLVRGGRPRSGGPDWRRLGLLSVAFLAVFSTVVGVSAAATIWYGTTQITRVEIPEITPVTPVGPTEAGVDADGDGDPDEVVEELTEVLNVLLVGSDDRSNLTEQQLLELGTEEQDGTRTDTIMLLQLDPRREQVSVISFPRDLLVTRCDGSRGRINAAFGIGEARAEGTGPSCLVQTVTDFTGIPVNHFVQIDFAGFIDIVDALGGVTLFLDEPIVERFAGADFPAGCVTMSGTDALSFVRVRRLDSDFGRIARQQRFMREVLSQAASLGTLVNPVRLFNVVDAGADTITTDPQLTLRLMQRIAFSLRDLGPEGLDTRTVPATPRTINGAAFVVADEAAAETLFTAFREGELAPEEIGRDEPVPIGVDDVPPVLVLNGAGVAGLAAQAVAQLEALGLAVEESGNADSFDFARTQVVHAPDQLEEAELLARAVGGEPVLVAGEDDEPLTVVLGQDWEPRDIDAEELGGQPLPEEDAEPTPAPTQTPSFAGAEPSGSC